MSNELRDFVANENTSLRCVNWPDVVICGTTEKRPS